MTLPADIVTTYSKDDLTARLRAYLDAANCPVTDRESGGFIQTLMEAWRDGLVDYLGPANPDPMTRAQVVAGPVPLIPDKRTGDTSAWLTLAVGETFSVDRNIAIHGSQFASTYTQQTVRLSCDSVTGPYTLTGGSFWVRSPVTGNRYMLLATQTVPNSGHVDATFQAEFSSDSVNGLSYNDPAGTLTICETPLPGLTANNLAPTFSAVVPTPNPASGLGVVTVGGTPPASATGYDVKITTDGQVGTALFQYRSNGGAWSANTATAGSFTIPSGPTVHFANDGGGATPSFLAGDRYAFTSPGTPVTQQGIDPETDDALLARGLGRWPDLNAIPDEKHKVWAKKASALVKRVRVYITGPGAIAVTIAGAVNPLAGGVVTAVQLYIDQREGIGWISTVAVATVVTITPTGGTVKVPAHKLLAVQALASANWNAYVSSDDIGGDLFVAKLEQILMDAGAVDVTGLALGGFTGVVPLGPNDVPVAADIVTNLTWLST